MHVICILTLCSNTNSSAVSVKLAEMQFRLFLNMPLSSCKFKYSKRNSSCLVLVSLCMCLNHKEKRSYTWLISGHSWKSQMRFGSHENNLWFYFLVSSLVAWWIFCLMRQNEMYDTQIQNKLGFKVTVRENPQLTNTDKKPLPACQHWKHDNTHPYWLTAK